MVTMQGFSEILNISFQVELATIVLLVHVLGPGIADTDDSGHAPCYDCEMFSVMQQDHPVHKRQVSVVDFTV